MSGSCSAPAAKALAGTASVGLVEPSSSTTPKPAANSTSTALVPIQAAWRGTLERAWPTSPGPAGRPRPLNAKAKYKPKTTTASPTSPEMITKIRPVRVWSAAAVLADPGGMWNTATNKMSQITAKTTAMIPGMTRCRRLVKLPTPLVHSIPGRPTPGLSCRSDDLKVSIHVADSLHRPTPAIEVPRRTRDHALPMVGRRSPGPEGKVDGHVRVVGISEVAWVGGLADPFQRYLQAKLGDRECVGG